MLFHLFCMFHDYWRINCRSQNSAGKKTVKIPYFWRSAVPGEHRRVPISPEDGGSQKGSQRWATRGPHLVVARAHPWSRRHRVREPWPTTGSPLRVLHPPRTLRHGESSWKYSAPSMRWKTPEREKLSGREKSAVEIPSRRREIIAIVTIIELDFIGIIIIIISIVITIISTAPLCSAVTSRVESCLFHRGNFSGVNYSLWLMLLSETVELRFMSRLLFIIISPLIIIHMMSVSSSFSSWGHGRIQDVSSGIMVSNI